MIRHIVIIHFQKKAGLDYLALLEKTRPLIEQISGVIRYQLYRNESKYVPEQVTSIGVEILFKDQRALELFMEHPQHFEANALFEKHFADPPYMVLTHPIEEKHA